MQLFRSVLVVVALTVPAVGQEQAGTDQDHANEKQVEDPAWKRIIAAAKWKTDDDVKVLLEDVFGDCELAPEDDRVWRDEEIRICRRKQQQLIASLKGQVIVTPTEVKILAVDPKQGTATRGLRGWVCHGVQRIDWKAIPDVERYVLVSVPHEWWTRQGTCTYEPAFDLFATQVTIPIASDDEKQRLMASWKSEMVTHEQGIDLSAEIVLRMEGLFSVKARPIKEKFQGKRFVFAPVRQGIKAKLVGWKLKVGDRVMVGTR